jgi:uncharacterized SAM-binding protein YcdF (DUF218 family)
MKADAIICLGGGVEKDGSLTKDSKARVERAVELYQEGLSSTIIFSGGSIFLVSQVLPKTEAQLMKEYSLSLGIPESSILLEEKSKDTIGTAYFTKIDFAKPRYWRNLAVVTSDYHVPRAKLIVGRIFGPEYTISYLDAPTSFSVKERLLKLEEERKLTSMILPYLERIEPGNDEQIENMIKTEHPAYKQKI